MFLRKGLAGAVIASLVIIVGLLGATETARAQFSHSANLAPTPPMGWNSYDSYGGNVTEEEMRRNADHMAQHLARLGWKYVVVDFYWYYPHPSLMATTKATWKWRWTITGGCFLPRTGFLRRRAARDSNLSPIISTARD